MEAGADKQVGTGFNSQDLGGRISKCSPQAWPGCDMCDTMGTALGVLRFTVFPVFSALSGLLRLFASLFGELLLGALVAESQRPDYAPEAFARMAEPYFWPKSWSSSALRGRRWRQDYDGPSLEQCQAIGLTPWWYGNGISGGFWGAQKAVAIHRFHKGCILLEGVTEVVHTFSDMDLVPLKTQVVQLCWIVRNIKHILWTKWYVFIVFVPVDCQKPPGNNQRHLNIQASTRLGVERFRNRRGSHVETEKSFLRCFGSLNPQLYNPRSPKNGLSRGSVWTMDVLNTSPWFPAAGLHRLPAKEHWPFLSSKRDKRPRRAAGWWFGLSPCFGAQHLLPKTTWRCRYLTLSSWRMVILQWSPCCCRG